MYSTLLHQKCLKLILLNNRGSFREFVAQQKQTKTIIFVRNPYTRLISLFEDKFVRFPDQSLSERIKYGDDNGWQVCQKIFFPYLNLSENSSTETIRNQLKSISFAKFILLLPKVYHQEIHFHPQTVILQQCQINQASIIKIEKLDYQYIQKELGLDLSLKLNQNPKKNTSYIDYISSSEILKTINSLYQEDFDYFNYHQYQFIEELSSSLDSPPPLPNWLFGI